MKLDVLKNISWALRILILIGVAIIFNVGYFPVGILEIVIVIVSLFFLRSRNKTVIISVFLILLLFVLNISGILIFYEKLPFYDDALHVLGSVILTLIVFSILNHKLKNRKLVSFLTVVALLFVILFWEFYEFVWDFLVAPSFDIPLTQVDFIDTLSDVFWGILGAVIAVTFLSRRNSLNLET